MSVNVPTNSWRRTSGNGELGTTDESLITLSDLQLITLGGLELFALPGTYTPVPATIWNKDDPTPASVWRKTSGLDESVADGPNNIDDPQNNLLVDPQGNYVVDTGIEMNVTPQTEWMQDDSI